MGVLYRPDALTKGRSAGETKAFNSPAGNIGKEGAKPFTGGQ